MGEKQPSSSEKEKPDVPAEKVLSANDGTMPSTIAVNGQTVEPKSSNVDGSATGSSQAPAVDGSQSQATMGALLSVPRDEAIEGRSISKGSSNASRTSRNS